jgi:ketosteroid isomerase-like protein
MSENLDLVRSIYADWERGDFTHVEWADPEIDYAIMDGPAPGRWRGVAGMAKGWGDALGAWTDLHAEAEDYQEVDEERVLTLARNKARGRESGIELPEAWTRHAAVFHIRDGKITRLLIYFDRDRALADLELAE